MKIIQTNEKLSVIQNLITHHKIQNLIMTVITHHNGGA